MKTKLLFFAMLAGMNASATVTVTPLSVNYSTKKVTFSVSWTGKAANNLVWVWVDLCPIAGTTAGTFAKADISNPSAIAGNIATVAGNTRGFFVTTNPSTVTATLSNAGGNFNWCAYGSDYPPNATANGSGGYALRGSPPFIITTSSGTYEVTADSFTGGAITSITDATGYPPVLCGDADQPAGLFNCCNAGTANCGGTCKTTGTYERLTGPCTGACATAKYETYDQCGICLGPSGNTGYTIFCPCSDPAFFADGYSFTKEQCPCTGPAHNSCDLECGTWCRYKGYPCYKGAWNSIIKNTWVFACSNVCNP